MLGFEAKSASSPGSFSFLAKNFTCQFSGKLVQHMRSDFFSISYTANGNELIYNSLFKPFEQ